MALLSSAAHARAATPPAAPATEATPTLTPEPAPPAPPLPLDGAPLPLDDAPMPPAAATTSTTPTPTPAPTLTPEQAPVSPLVLDQPTTQATGRPVPFYRKDWFWGVVGVAILTTAVILVSVASSGTDTPNTTLGNMRAF